MDRSHRIGGWSLSEAEGKLQKVLVGGMDKGLAIHRPFVVRHVERLRRNRPGASPKQVIRALEKHYLASVSLMGGAAGAAAFIPGEGVPAGLVASAIQVPAFFEASALFALSVAEVHGIAVDDLERRRTLILAILLGDSGARVVEQAAGRTGKHWGRWVVSKISKDQILRINKVLGHNFITKQGTKQGILVLGREIPLGIGVAIGAGGNFAIGKGCVNAARRAFGPPPTQWPTDPTWRLIGSVDGPDIDGDDAAAIGVPHPAIASRDGAED
jgi:hypothetical protein